jgi:lipopolysaccharide export LptBFGC system permease protein LptF
MMCLAVSIVAAPVGARAQRSGRSYTFASGVLIIAGYFVLRSLVKDIYMPNNALAILVAQIPNLVLMAAGAVFIWRVDRI